MKKKDDMGVECKLEDVGSSSATHQFQPLKCENCHNFFSTPEQQNRCYQCFLKLCKDNNIPIPSNFIKSIPVDVSKVFSEVLSGVVEPTQSSTAQILAGMEDKNSLLSVLPEDIIKYMHDEHVSIKFCNDMRVSDIQMNRLIKIMKQPDLTFTSFINYLTHMNFLKLIIKTCGHKSHQDEHTAILGSDIGIELCIHMKTVCIIPLKLFTAEQASKLYHARNESVESVESGEYEYKKNWIWEHLICFMVGDFWNIAEPGFGNVSVCYYDRSPPEFIMDNQDISDELTILQASTNRQKLLNEIKSRSSFALGQMHFGQKQYIGDELNIDIYDYSNNYIKTGSVDSKYYSKIFRMY